MNNVKPLTVIDRETGKQFEEKIMGEKWIRWAYQESRSSLLKKLFFHSTIFSRLMGWWYDSSLSKSKIIPTIEELSIDTSEFADPTVSYKSFNNFFTRKLKPEARPFDDSPDVLVSPAEGRVFVFPKLNGDTFIPVKGHPFTIDKLIPGYDGRFTGGALAIIRLCPADYHRYHFPCDGRISHYREVPGNLHSVNPIALASGADVFGQNKRALTILETKRFGQMCYVEVGAFGVGSIINIKQSGDVKKMEEKGYFKFGGSTIIIIFEPDRITFSQDLIENSNNGMETLIKVGQNLAMAVP